MTLKTVIAALKTVPTGTPVSYGHTAKTTRPTVLATLPIGYADGFLRRNADRFTLLINGKKAPLVGRMCMDQCMIDVTDVPDVRVGMEITVFGNGGASVADYAVANDTIPYEVMSILTARVPRVAEGGKSLA